MKYYGMTSDDVTAIMGLVDTFVRWKSKNGMRGYEKYHPSEFGKCSRKMQYLRYASKGLIKYDEENFTSKQIRLFDQGHNMHSRWQKYFADMGVLRGAWKCSNLYCKLYGDDGKFIQSIDEEKLRAEYSRGLNTRVFGLEEKKGVFKPSSCSCGNRHFIYSEVLVEEKELNMLGHADLILDFSKLDINKFHGTMLGFNKDNLPSEPIVIDMKTINDYRFKQLSKDGPSMEYIIQLTIYTNILDCPFGLIIYENKNSSDALCFKIERNPEIFDTIKMQAKAMNEMIKSTPPLLPPPKARDKDDYECSHCGFKSICHNSKIWEDPKLPEKRKKFYENLL